jgi:hypothetical protein
MAALLEDALRCSPQEVRDDSWREAAGWVFSNDRSYVFSFLSVCDALRIDYGWLRMVVRGGSARNSGGLDLFRSASRLNGTLRFVDRRREPPSHHSDEAQRFLATRVRASAVDGVHHLS